jgi:hypothetical protein
MELLVSSVMAIVPFSSAKGEYVTFYVFFGENTN